MKRSCLLENWGGTNKVEYTSYCYNDIQALYGIRGLSERKIPYFEVLPYEYPPLIAGQMYLTSLVSKSHSDFFVVNFWVNLFCYAFVLWLFLKEGEERGRILTFCLSSCLFLYLGMNWDATSVLLLVLLLYSVRKSHFFGAGVFAGLSLGGKLFPVFCLAPAAFASLKEKKTLKELVFGGVTGAGILYLPLFLFSLWKTGNLDPLLSIFLFHAKRLPEYDTVWHWIAGVFGYSPFDDAYRIFVERLSSVLLFLFMGILFFRRKNKASLEGKCAALITVLLMVSKIYSPQYALWLLPFFVLTPIPIKWIYAFYLTDLWGFFARFSWYPVMGTADEYFWKNQLMWAVFFRTLVLFFFIYHWLFGSKKTA